MTLIFFPYFSVWAFLLLIQIFGEILLKTNKFYLGKLAVGCVANFLNCGVDRTLLHKFNAEGLLLILKTLKILKTFPIFWPHFKFYGVTSCSEYMQLPDRRLHLPVIHLSDQ
jgi:hypothetical protein